MIGRLRQSTAVTVSVGPFVDSVDGVTPETALTITPALRKLSKAGGVLAATSDTSNATHDADGWYRFTLTAVDLATLGVLQLSIQVAGAAPFFASFEVIPPDVWDAEIAGISARGAVHYGTAQGGSASGITLATTASAVDDFYNGCDVVLIGGTGAGQARGAQDYVGSSRGIVTDRAWVTNPDSSTKYAILPRGFLMATLAEASAAIGGAQLSGALHAPSVRPTRDQALLFLERVFAHLANGTTTTDLVKDVDGTTNLATLTYSPDKTDPTTRQRTS